MKHNHLCKVPNNDEGKAFIRTLKKLMRDNNSRYKVRLKGRSPKGGYKAYNGGSDGSVRLSEATQVAIYLTDTVEGVKTVTEDFMNWKIEDAVVSAFNRGLQVGKDVAYKRSAELIEDHRRAMKNGK